MQKIFHFDSPVEPYRADATVLCCFDDRFQLVLRKFVRRLAVERADVICVAGAGKALASPAHEYEREFVLEQLRASLRLHQSPRIILTAHADCGAYGGSAAFRDRPAEAAHHWEELHRAAELVRRALPGVRVDCYFIDFEGAWSDASATDSPARTPHRSGTRV